MCGGGTDVEVLWLCSAGLVNDADTLLRCGACLVINVVILVDVWWMFRG